MKANQRLPAKKERDFANSAQQAEGISALHYLKETFNAFLMLIIYKPII